jgi:oxalate---CoA ligase
MLLPWRPLVGRSAGPAIAVLVDGVPAACGAGEVLICGQGVMRGYLASAHADRAHSDHDAFVDRWFRTGDIGEIDRGGRLRLHGRSKEIINVGGEKVPPFEVEKVLLAHKCIREAVAYAMPSERLGEEVHAVVVISAETDERALRSYARERLAKFKTPTRIHIVAEIPKGPTGKVQRRLLAGALATTS